MKRNKVVDNGWDFDVVHIFGKASLQALITIKHWLVWRLLLTVRKNGWPYSGLEESEFWCLHRLTWFCYCFIIRNFHGAVKLAATRLVTCLVEALVNCAIVCQSYLLRAPDCRRTLTGTLYSGHPFLKPIISGFVESLTLQLITSLNGLEPLIVLACLI